MRFVRALALAALSIPVFSAAVPIAIRDVTVIDVTNGAERAHQTVLIRGERIGAIGPSESTPIPPGARVVPAEGKFLIPGLWDMHVHLWYPENQLPVYVANGITGVRDMGSDYKRTSAWAEAVEKGRMLGPHIVTSGPPVDGIPSKDPRLPVLVARTPAEARQAFDRLWNMDVDFIKVLSGVPRDAYFALAEQSRHWDLRLSGRVPESVSAREAVESRQRSIEHMFGVLIACSAEHDQLEAQKRKALDAGNRAALARIALRALQTFSDNQAVKFFDLCARYGTRHTPTLTLWERMAHTDDEALVSDPRLAWVPASIRRTWPDAAGERGRLPAGDLVNLRWQMRLVFRMVSLARQAGVELLAGTDTGDPYTIPGATLHDELQLLVEAGLTPLQALQAATIAPARFLGWDGSMGTVSTGLVADLVLLEADPLEDIGNTQKISGVFVKGTYRTKAELEAILGGVR